MGEKKFSSILLLPNGTQRSGRKHHIITEQRARGDRENAILSAPAQSIGADLSRISGVPCEHLSAILVRIVTHSRRVRINLSAIEAIADGCVPAPNCRRDAIRNGLFTARASSHIRHHGCRGRVEWISVNVVVYVRARGGRRHRNVASRRWMGNHETELKRSHRPTTTTAEKMCVAANAIARSTKNVTYK